MEKRIHELAGALNRFRRIRWHEREREFIYHTDTLCARGPIAVAKLRGKSVNVKC